MNKVLMGFLALGAVGVILVGVVAFMYMDAHNSEVGLRNTITAKQTDNTSEFDNLKKKISQSAQVTDAQMDSLKEIFVEHAAARTGDGGGTLMNWIQESVPNVDTSVYTNLQNIITGSRDRWTMRQKELLDLKRQHDNILTQMPSSFFLSGREKIDVQIVTSASTKESFETGEDNETDVFQKD